MNCHTPSKTRQRVMSGLASALMAAMTTAGVILPQANVQAQQAATGSVTGRVMNAEDGKYLPRARITIPGTNIETFTDDYGQFELRDVPAGDVTINADFTGQNTLSTPVSVKAGQTISKDLRFNADRAKTTADGAIVLDEFQVQAQRFQNARQIAINEERFSPNIKNVVSVDAFGDIPNGNVGEFVKFLPGVLVSYGAYGGANQGYSDSDATGISVRGFGPEDTTILIDGMPVSNANPGSLTRQVGLDMLSINNASRVELIKVPTPDMPSNSIGGQVNLITKSAFEYARPEINYSVFATMNSLNTELGKTPGPVNKKTYKTKPGASFTVVYPMSAKMGISLTGFWNDEFNQTHRSESTYTYTGSLKNAAGNQVSLQNPYLSRYRITDTPRVTEKRSANVKFDWKPTPAQLLTVNVQYSTYDGIEAQRRLDMQPANPTDWSADYTIGAVNNTSSRNNMTVGTRDKIGNTTSGQLQYKLQWGGWDFSAAASQSVSNGKYVDTENGHYSEVAMQLQPGHVSFYNISDGRPDGVDTRARTTNNPLDYTQLANWKFDGTTAKSGEAFSKNTVGLYRIDIGRQLDFIPWLGSNTMAFKTGIRRDQEKTEKWGRGTGYREILKPGASYAVTDILDTDYIGISPGYGMPAQQWASSYKLYDINQQNSIFYAPEDGGDAVGNYDSYVNQQKSITETRDGAYAMLEGRFFKNRLTFVGGARQERREREGYGPYTDTKWNYVKDKNGLVFVDSTYTTGVVFNSATSPLFAQTAAGQALRDKLTSLGYWYPTTAYGATNVSLASRKLNLIPNRYIHQKVTGDPSYSMSVSFDLTKKIVLKAAWSRTFGMPALEDSNQGILSGNNSFRVDERIPASDDGIRGVITVANPALQPKISDNWDLQATYYTDSGGKLSLSYYYKTVTNDVITLSTISGSDTFNALLPALGLDPADYEDWRVDTSTNSASKQTTDGWELEVSQDFRFLGNWGKHFQAFASFTYKNLADAPTIVPYYITSPTGQQILITPTQKTISLTSNRFAGAGLQYASKRLTLMARATYRNRNELSPFRVSLGNGNFVRRFEPEEIRVDLSASYRLTDKYSLFVSARDALNAKRGLEIKDDFGQLASYAEPFEEREFGVSVYFGVNGKF